ncbi:MAG: peptidylprolyl isomerase [Candidatus Nitrosopumilus limneticus]|nr:Peptidylprolyl isomerase [Candidatus Nitrosopumilus limneticus]MDC4211980.1 peptidylprolyl isomerase [Candidatus Nitrosopumilus limneticus]MDC4214726.1 peptidylprolyl isomerase [Candidatus Nitrosopumilus limneticus]MDC4216205.1 peptidylprolyl isomerase [Candidatus Nitrosopumilus limneticus]MDC4218363.1 peptidylprolyl isomerase [Candidatus Nitrosopumilus limneticus]
MIRVVFTFIFILLSIGLVNLVDAAIYNDPVIIIQTNQGDIVIEFFIADAENHVTNFIQLSRDGFYDGTLFHRIIPGFMIQGGDPNTINGNPDTWGQGGPDKKLNQEFNSIKHNRGIVSMARSADPNSAGSQFFIIHKNSNFLDGEYTAFGRIATEESFRTLDRIAAVQTETNDRPVDPEQVRIIKTAMVNRDSVLGIIDYVEPERTGSSIKEVTDNQIFESEELGISFSPPEGWLLQQPDQSTIGAPDVAAVGPKTDGVNPVISLTIENAANKTIDDLIKEKNNLLDAAITSKQLEILSQKLIRTNVYQTEAIGNFQVDDKTLKIKFIDVIILSEEKSYTFAYNNLLDNFDNEITKFNKSLDSFKILSQDNTIMEISTETLDEEKGGGCLIATATYGSELAPQVQLLREIRDNSLLNTESGTVFMKTFNEFYYSFSPTIADYERENPVFKEAVKLAITPMISTLSLMENANSESEVLGIGISVIALNLAMYIGVPAIIVIGIKKKI